jgi:hypothetical protein
VRAEIDHRGSAIKKIEARAQVEAKKAESRRTPAGICRLKVMTKDKAYPRSPSKRQIRTPTPTR